MAQKSSGTRHGTRKKLEKEEGSEGTIAGKLQSFGKGDKVVIDTEPAVQEGMPHPRFHGRTATVAGERGNAYVVKLHDGGKEKEITSNPAHLVEVEG